MIGILANIIWYKKNSDENTIFLSRKAKVLVDYCEWEYNDYSVFEENHCIDFSLYLDVENEMDKMIVEVKPLYYYFFDKRYINVNANILASNRDSTTPNFKKNQIEIYDEDDYSLHIQHTVPISRADVGLLHENAIDYIVYEILIYDEDRDELYSERRKIEF